MKYADFKIDETTIEFHNSLVGNEKVLVDGKVVSEKFSIFGTKHKFELNNKEFQLISSTIFLGIGLKLELTENEKLIDEKSIYWTRHSLIWFSAGLLVGFVLSRYWQ